LLNYKGELIENWSKTPLRLATSPDLNRGFFYFPEIFGVTSFLLVVGFAEKIPIEEGGRIAKVQRGGAF